MTQAETLATALEREHHEIDDGIEAFTGSRATGPPDVAALTNAMSALRRHIYLEEEFVFPPLRAAGMLGPVLVMLREHGEIWQVMDEIDVRLAEPGADVVPLCTQLLERLAAHNAKEEPIVYPQADAVLAEEETHRLRDFLVSGRTPEGWVATQARGDRPSAPPWG